MKNVCFDVWISGCDRERERVCVGKRERMFVHCVFERERKIKSV